MAKKRTTKNANPVIVVAIIGLIGTLASAILSSPVLLAKIQNTPVPTKTHPTTELTTLAPTETALVDTSTIPAPASSQGVAANDNQPILLPNTAGLVPNALEKIVSYGEVVNYSSSIEPGLEFVLELPDSISPDINPVESLDEIIMKVQSQEIFFQPHISTKIGLLFTLQNIQGNDGLDVKIEKIARVTVLDYQSAKSPITALVGSRGFLIPVTGGGGFNFDLEPVSLESFDWKNRVYSTSLTEYDSVILEPGEIGTFDFLLTCKDPGVYLAVITVQVFYSGKSYDIELYPPKLNCPESLTIWDYKVLSNDEIHYEWIKLGDYVLQDGEYISLSADDATATPIQ